MKINLLGIDLAKNVFQLCALNQANKILFNRSVRRAQLSLQPIARLEPTTIAMEACSSAHYWARAFEALGHQVVLVPAQHVKPFVRGGKSDARDALAICEAAQRPGSASRCRSSRSRNRTSCSYIGCGRARCSRARPWPIRSAVWGASTGLSLPSAFARLSPNYPLHSKMAATICRRSLVMRWRTSCCNLCAVRDHHQTASTADRAVGSSATQPMPSCRPYPESAH